MRWGVLAPCTAALPQKSGVESHEYQNDSYVNRQALPELVPEEQHINGDDYGYHYDYVKYIGRMEFHFGSWPSCFGAPAAA
jgi:hypothetical protein